MKYENLLRFGVKRAWNSLFVIFPWSVIFLMFFSCSALVFQCIALCVSSFLWHVLLRRAHTHTHSLTWAVLARAGGAVRMSVLHFRHTENIWSGVDHSATRVCRDQSHGPLLPLRRCSWHRVCVCVCFTIKILTVVHAVSWACVYSVFKSNLNTWIQVFVLVYACVLCVWRCRICSALNTWTVNMAP